MNESSYDSSLRATGILAAVIALVLVPASWVLGEAEMARGAVRVPILVYHRFGPSAADPMTVTTEVFESHLRYFEKNDYTVIPLRYFVDYRLGKGPPPPPRSVVITTDDGHRSTYTEMLPLVRQYRIPVTLFIYPSAISNAEYALTWNQLREMQKTGLFEIQSHSFWHPNFKKEKQRRTADDYERFVATQLTRSRETLQGELGVPVDILAWPFGIYDDELIRKAVEAGCVAAVTLERRHATEASDLMALPRYLITDRDRGKTFERLVSGASTGP